MRTTALSPAIGLPLPVRLALAVVLGFGVALVALPQLAAAAEPEPTAQVEASATPDASSTPAPTSDPVTATAPPAATPTPEPTPTAPPAAADPEGGPDPTPTPEPTPVPPPPPPPPTTAPPSMNLFVASAFTFQDPNMSACTSTAVRTMLNFIALRGSGGEGFGWLPTLSATVRDQILAWERSHDTLAGGTGSDPHGWRNALNYYGWGEAALWAGARVYDDASYGTYASAMRATVRALIKTGKPVGVLGWRGAHAQMITGYYGLVGDPFERDATGRLHQHLLRGRLLRD